MTTIDHEIHVYSGYWECSCGENKVTQTTAKAKTLALNHAKKYSDNSRVIDTEVKD